MDMENLEICLIVFFVLLPIWGGFIVGGIYFFRNTKPRNCSLYVHATIIDVEEIWIKGQYYYLPVCQYEYKGEVFEKSFFSLAKYTYGEVQETVGTGLELYIDPENPKNYYFPGDSKTSKLLGGILVGVGLMVALIPIGMFLFL